MTGTQIATIRKKHLPLKHKVRYPKAVTVCIAAACKEGNEPRVVLCSDTRLDYQEFGSTNMTCKLDILGHGWCSQMAGDWSGVKELNRLLRTRVQKLLRPITPDEMAEHCKRSIAQFLKSPFFHSDGVFQLLISGFHQGRPALLKISVFTQQDKIEMTEGFAAIGEGESISSILLRQREAHPGMEFSYAAYLAYEAKRASEKCGGVGIYTNLVSQAPQEVDDNERASMTIMNEQGIANLESLYHTVWKVPFLDVPPLGNECFIESSKKQAPE